MSVDKLDEILPYLTFLWSQGKLNILHMLEIFYRPPFFLLNYFMTVHEQSSQLQVFHGFDGFIEQVL